MPTWRGCLMSISGLSGLELDASTSEFVTSLRSSLETCEKNYVKSRGNLNFQKWKFSYLRCGWFDIRHYVKKFVKCVCWRQENNQLFWLWIQLFLQNNFFEFSNDFDFTEKLVWQFDSLKSLGQLLVSMLYSKNITLWFRRANLCPRCLSLNLTKIGQAQIHNCMISN